MKNKWLMIIGLSVLISGCQALDDTVQDDVPDETENEVEQNLNEQPNVPEDEETEKTPEDKPEIEEPVDEDTDSGQGSNTESPDDSETNVGEEEDDQSTAEQPVIPTVADPTSITVMVNKSAKLPDGYRPADLVRPDVPFAFGNQQLEKALLRKEAALALENMFAAAKVDGITLVAASGFRSYETQSMLFENEVKQFGYEKASMAVAYPGTSEHQTGLTMDITAASVNHILTEQLGQKPEGKWLEKNAHQFGFILRYPLGKESITGYQYEPWHFRYVGVQIATEIFEKQLTLEEYYQQKEGI
ncbi:hypothetical protein GCM10008967_25440 [Bacillus carboniphilus]|uniref:D-alanyl-D-alanine carboxypeptidase-like core domain-containing protein n=1 Tax=Bacillus carboniphilus TaxID=86663 RepID=A0ABN0WDC1_9BACI